jgi:hypothetical protein
VHRLNLSGHEAQRISQRITHLKTLLEELKKFLSAIWDWLSDALNLEWQKQ